MGLRSRIIIPVATVLMALFVVAGTAIVMTAATSFQQMKDAYALWHVGQMYVLYMREHDGQTPGSWVDLDPYFKQMGASWSTPEEIKRRVVVDFTFKPFKDTPRPDSKPAVVVSLRDGPHVVFENGDPNRLIDEFVRSKTMPPAASRTAIK